MAHSFTPYFFITLQSKRICVTYNKLKMSIFSKFTPLVNWVRNRKYLFVTIIFLLIVIVFDDNSMIMHFRNQSKINALEEEIATMMNDSAEVERRNALIGPDGVTSEIEKICREKYDMHTQDEDVFIIED